MNPIALLSIAITADWQPQPRYHQKTIFWHIALIGISVLLFILYYSFNIFHNQDRFLYDLLKMLYIHSAKKEAQQTDLK